MKKNKGGLKIENDRGLGVLGKWDQVPFQIRNVREVFSEMGKEVNRTHSIEGCLIKASKGQYIIQLCTFSFRVIQVEINAGRELYAK